MSVTTHVIFDLGDTISDIKTALEAVFQEYAQSQGKVPKSRCLSEEMGDEDDDYFKSILKSIDDDTYKYADKFKDFQKWFISRVIENGIKLCPGVNKLLNHLHRHNIPMAIASNGDNEEIQVMLKAEGLDTTLFSHITAGAEDPEVKNNKPAPDIYLVCAKRFSCPPESNKNCVIFEDSIRGITGAVKTGMKTVLVNDNPVLEVSEIKDKITVIVDSLENFKPESVGLPPYE